jgi:hypothetical protein
MLDRLAAAGLSEKRKAERDLQDPLRYGERTMAVQKLTE